jgi:hypothetical protein
MHTLNALRLSAYFFKDKIDTTNSIETEIEQILSKQDTDAYLLDNQSQWGGTSCHLFLANNSI